jgi:hypothetical protein
MPSHSLVLALLSLTLAAPAAVAQYTGDGGQSSGGQPGRMHGFGRGGAPPDPVVLEGPLAPAALDSLARLSPDKADEYKGLYDRFRAETKPQRDSLAALRSGAGGDTGDRDAMRRRRDVFVPLNDELTRRQAAFDDALHDLLDKGQWNSYQKWRDQRRKDAEKEGKERWRHHGGGDRQPA